MGGIAYVLNKMIGRKKKEPVPRPQTSTETFTYIYDNKIWGVGEDGSGSSGWGSSLVNARPYIEFLLEFMKANQVRSVVDAGCGDCTFTRHIHWGGINYVGIDVVKNVIEKNKQQFRAPNVTFIHGDLLEMDLPPADLLICKEVLQHLTNQDIEKFLKNARKYKHCLITNDIEISGQGVGEENRNISRGDSRVLDLAKPPFSIKGVNIFTYPVNEYHHIKQVFHIQNQN